MMNSRRHLSPIIRFPQFSENYNSKRIESALDRVVNPVHVIPGEDYYQIGIRSHGKGIFHKDSVKGADLGNKRVFWIEEDLLVLNIVFAWEQAVAKTTSSEVGMIASHRFPMYKQKSNVSVLDYVVSSFLTQKGKHLLGLASPGGAGRNKTLGQKEFARLKLNLPSTDEQKKVADFLTCIEKRIHLLREKKTLLKQYKKGVMQKLFSQEIRFKDNDGNDYPDWREMALSELLYEHKKRNDNLEFDKSDVLSVSGDRGVVNQIEHLGRSYAGESVANYHVVHTRDIVYTKSPLKSNPYGIIKANKGNSGIVSTLYAVYSPKKTVCSEYLDYYFEIDDNTNRYLRPLVHKGAKNDMKIKNSRVLIDSIVIPHKPEQEKIVVFLDVLSKKNEMVDCQLRRLIDFKKGLLQQMFV